MAFRVPERPVSNTPNVTGDIEISAFDHVATILNVPGGAIPVASLPNIDSGSFLANITGSTAAPTDHSLSTFAGTGLTYTNLTGVLTWDGLNFRKNSAGSVFTRRRINLIEGSNVTITVADDAGDDEVDVTIAATGSGGSIDVRKNSTGSVFTRPRINLIEGSNVTLTVADDAGDDEVDVTIAATGGGSSETPLERFVLAEDFTSAPGTSGSQTVTSSEVSHSFGTTTWTTVTIGTGSLGTITHTAGVANHPGQIVLTTGSTINSGIRLFHNGPGWVGGTRPAPILFDDIESVVWWAQIPDSTNMFCFIGMWSATSTANGFGFMLDTSAAVTPGGASWYVQTNVSSSPVFTAITGVTTMSKYEMRVSSGQVEFYIDNSLVATHTTGIPTGVALTPYLVIANRTAVARTATIDLFYLRSAALTR